MTGKYPNTLARDLRTLLDGGEVGGLTDGELLGRFVDRRDPSGEAAFTALLRRHGPMVWGVCRRALADPHAAADAFQATFLVLVRKAATIRVDDSLGRWLYGVSRKVALRARADGARRSAREAPGAGATAAMAMAMAAPEPAPDRSELLAILDEEIGRLPGRYRAAVVLCDLGQMSHEEAARQLGCAVGTVGSRLNRGRQRLRDRLTRRGLAPPAGLAMMAGLPMAAGSVSGSASAAVPPALAEATALAALRVVAGGGASIAANVLSLSKGTLHAMLSTKLNYVLALGSLATLGFLALSLRPARVQIAPPQAVGGGAAVAGPAAGPAEPIIARMLTTYTAARSYADEGEVVQVFDYGTRRETTKKPFATRFVRPRLFRYEFSHRNGGAKDSNLFVVWTDAAPDRSKTWWTLRPEIQEATLPMALGAGVGISGYSSMTIPALLMPGSLSSHVLVSLREPRLTGEEAVDGAPCDRVEGEYARGNIETVWIDKATSLVRRIFIHSLVNGAKVEETTTYRPRVDVEIPPDRFTFEPPKQK